MGSIEGIVFDLDDTLTLERDYVRSGFAEVARVVGERNSIPSEELFRALWKGFEEGVRGNSFDRLLAEFPTLALNNSVYDFVEIYRKHEPQMELLPGMISLLQALKAKGDQIALISDGPLVCQEAKYRALQLDRWIELPLLTDRWGRDYWKPHPRAFEQIQAEWNLPPDHLIYIGDNPEKDFIAPKGLGWHTIRFKIKQQLRYDRMPPSPQHAPEMEASSVEQLSNILLA